MTPRQVRNRELRQLVRRAQRQGWAVTYTGGGHLRWQAPDGALVFTPSTPNGGCRSLENTRADLRRVGLEV